MPRLADIVLAGAQRHAPKSRQLTLARRKLPIVRIRRRDIASIRRLIAAELGSVDVVKTAAVTSGYSPATASITRVHLRAAGGDLKVAVKEFRRSQSAAKNWLPREVRISRLHPWLKGRFFRLPLAYGHIVTAADQPALVAEWIDASSREDALNLRIRGLGELAATRVEAVPGLADILAAAPAYTLAGNARRGYLKAAEFVKQAQIDRLACRLEDLTRKAETRQVLDGDAMMGLAHADPQRVNLPIDRFGQVVLLDFGNLRQAAVGADLAAFVYRAIAYSTIGKHGSEWFERQALADYLEGFRSTGRELDETGLVHSYALEMTRQIEAGARRMGQMGNDARKIRREVKIIDRALSSAERLMKAYA